MGNWNFDELENSLVSDAEKRITRGYQQSSEQPPSKDARGQDARGQVPGSNNLAGTEPARYLSPGIPIGLKGPDTKGVQTYLPLKDYMRLLQQKTLRKQNIAQVAGVAIIDWLDRQEQEGAK